MNGVRKSRGIVGITILVLLPLLAIIMYAEAGADVDEKFEWNGKIRHLKVCLDNTGCVAGMRDSLQKAIDAWNNLNISWTLEYVDDCSQAQVKIKCGSLGRSLGLWVTNTDETVYGSATTCTVTVNKDVNWGTCNDKEEIVSTLIHELGHCMRLNDVAGQADVMRGEQQRPGHLLAPTNADKKEAMQSDGNTKKDTETSPPGGKKKQIYMGVITPGPDEVPFDLESALNFTLEPFDTSSLHDLFYVGQGNDAIIWHCYITPTADLSEAFTIVIDHGDSLAYRQGYLSVVDSVWDVAWMPTAVAPADTTLPQNAPWVVLDATASHHPAGFEAMDFQWWVEGPISGVFKGGPVTSVFLLPGDYTIELKAQDDFGNWASDFMHVNVESGGCDYMVGDINGNGAANGIDVVYGVSYLKGGSTPKDTCDCRPDVPTYPFYAAMDVNGNCQTNGIDITFYVAYLKGQQQALRYCADCPPADRILPVTIPDVRIGEIEEGGGGR